MNTERMLSVANRLQADLSRSNLPTLMAQLADALRNAASNPAEATFQNQVADLRRQVAAASAGSDVNNFSPIERQVLAEWHVEDLVGTSLQERVEAVFRANTITLATAAQELAPMASALQELAQNLANLINAMQFFQVKPEILSTGEFEIDVLIPRRAVKDELAELGKEFRELEKIVLPFVELTTGSRPPIQVKSISSSDFTVFLHSTPVVGACIASGIDRVVGVYERITNIRLAKAQIEQLELPSGDEAKANAAKPLEEYAASHIRQEVARIAAELIAEFATRLSSERTHELETEISRSLTEIAERIDDGFNIAVRAGPPPAPPDDSEGDDSAGLTPGSEAEILARYAAQVNESASRLKFMNISGARILVLASPNVDGPGEQDPQEATDSSDAPD